MHPRICEINLSLPVSVEYCTMQRSGLHSPNHNPNKNCRTAHPTTKFQENETTPTIHRSHTQNTRYHKQKSYRLKVQFTNTISSYLTIPSRNRYHRVTATTTERIFRSTFAHSSRTVSDSWCISLQSGRRADSRGWGRLAGNKSKAAPLISLARGSTWS